jgi:transcriptional regulator with GAF, ATPase, and Fis domain
MAPTLQAKLLRVLQEGEIRAVGATHTKHVNVRVVAACNRNLEQEVAAGRFREDLYYRLKVFPIRVPPLRERAEDIPLMVWAFVEELSARMGKKITRVPRKTMEALQRYPWPGNVRELRNVIEHGAIITPGNTLIIPKLEGEEGDARTLAEAEREIILTTLKRTNWHVKGPRGAAKALAINPATLYSRMKKLGIRPPSGMASDRS